MCERVRTMLAHWVVRDLGKSPSVAIHNRGVQFAVFAETVAVLVEGEGNKAKMS